MTSVPDGAGRKQQRFGLSAHAWVELRRADNNFKVVVNRALNSPRWSAKTAQPLLISVHYFACVCFHIHGVVDPPKL